MSSSRLIDPEQPERIGAYSLAGVLGEGGQGTVYRAESPSGAQVVIKVLHARMADDDDERRRFAREMDIAGQVATFCTASVIEMGVFRRRPYIVSEYIPGPSLHELIHREGPRTGSGLERLAVATLTALGAIHRAGIVHRDFKPANVIMGPEGPVVIDFGIARLLDQATTRSGIVGTPAYMAPEQLDGRTAGPASDVFSWAITMVFAATGRRAFPGDTAPAVINAIVNGEPDLDGVPDPLRPLVLSCLAKDPGDRPTTQELLARLTTRSPSTAPPPARSPAPVPPAAPAPTRPLEADGAGGEETGLYLRGYLRTHPPLAPGQAAVFAADLAEQLAALHAAGRAHGPLDTAVRVENSGGRDRPVVVASAAVPYGEAPAVPQEEADDVQAVGTVLAGLLGARPEGAALSRPGQTPGDLWSLVTASLDPDPAVRPALADLALRLRDAGEEPRITQTRPAPTQTATLVSEPTAPRSRGRGRKAAVAGVAGAVLVGGGIVFAVAGPPDEGNTAVHTLAATPAATPPAVAGAPVTPGPTSRRTPPPSASPVKSSPAKTGPAKTGTRRPSPGVPSSPPQQGAPSKAPEPPPTGGSSMDTATNYAWARGSVSWNGTTASANGRLQDTRQYESHSWLRIAYRLNVGGVWKLRYVQPDPYVEVANGQYKDFTFRVSGPVKDVQWDVCSSRLDKTFCTGWK
ncbi:hypothetical protein Pth03_42490 [Planotetraspora thailandica]|uniref:Protein kinase domain-containing protein n=1 Tax=Planotetraspora thailandica TaxID=487172 RepID=A0A8J3VDP2_9ACTN|nr:protein kinase [Planotetraspora thailandica]GII55860.1 hypothetical protein Pth03_42490 [Planotetraspora thailandica]